MKTTVITEMDIMNFEFAMNKLIEDTKKDIRDCDDEADKQDIIVECLDLQESFKKLQLLRQKGKAIIVIK